MELHCNRHRRTPRLVHVRHSSLSKGRGSHVSVVACDVVQQATQSFFCFFFYHTTTTLEKSTSMSTSCATNKQDTVMYIELPHRPSAADRGTTKRVTLLSRPFFSSKHSYDSGMAMALNTLFKTSLLFLYCIIFI